MPVILSTSNIIIDYGASNFTMETAKNELYLIDTLSSITSNLTAEPVITFPSTFTESIRTFTHNGGTEEQTSYNIYVGQNTICDILIVGGGGGGGGSIAGGGGGGSVIYSTNITIPAGSYSILVGKGGNGGVNETDGINGFNTIAFGATAIGGGRGGDYNISNSELSGGSGGGEGGGANNGQLGIRNAGLKGSNTIPITSPLFTNYQYYVNDGGIAFYQSGVNNWSTRGGGGGGAGSAGGNGGGNEIDTTTQGVGGDGIPISISGTTVYYGAGGGGGAHKGGNSQALGKSGGLGGGGNGGSEFSDGTKSNGTNGTGIGAGGGGGAYLMNGGNGGSGIVIIKFKSIVNAAIPEGNPITHKTLNFAYNAYNNDNLVAYYKFNDSSSLGLDSNPSSTKYNLTPTIIGGTGGYNTSIAIEGGSFQSTNDGDRLEGDFPLKSIYDNSSSGVSISVWFYKKLATYDNGYNTQLLNFTDPSNTLHTISVSLSHYNNNIYKTNFSIQYGVSGEVYSTAFGSTLDFETWYHLVFIITKSGNVKVYMNGTNLNLVAGSVDGTIRTYNSTVYPIPTSSFPNTTKLRIHNVFGQGSFSGNVDEFYVFNKELTQTEITNLYNKTYTIPPNPNQYTLNFPVPTIADIMYRTAAGNSIINNTNLSFQGAYEVNLTTTSASIITKTDQKIPFTSNYNLSNSSNIAFRYYLQNPRKAGAQWTYSSANANVYHMGNVGIGTNTPSHQLHVNGNMFVSSTAYTGSSQTTWATFSDRRIKDNIVKASYEKCLDNVKNIELYRFNFKDNAVNTNDTNQLGFIAQEVQSVYPKAVEVSKIQYKNGEIPDLLTLNTTQIDYTLYGAVKELINIVEYYEEILETYESLSNTSNTSNIGDIEDTIILDESSSNIIIVINELSSN